ncbi:creatininase family protein [Leptothrix sp. BB-4]
MSANPMRRLGLQAGLGLATAWAAPTAAATSTADATGASSVHVEDLTWTELRERIATGSTTLLIPVGGIEQSGPHLALGKHNTRVRALAGQIAQALGRTLVAPVLAHVPEGAIEPPTQHMRYPGTLSIPAPVFEAVLEATVRSYARHGLRHLVLLGDHGGYQSNLQAVAARLSKAGPHGLSGARVIALTEYYRATQTAYVEALKARGHRPAEIGEHAGLADTALSLALDPASVRQGRLAQVRPDADGVTGDPRGATAELGRLGVQAVLDASLTALRRQLAGA